MSTQLRDFANAAQLSSGSVPATRTATVTGPTVDFIAGDGRCFAVQFVGAVSGTAPTLAGKIQESADGTTWSDISGATFTSVGSADNLQKITFDRSMRYLRYVGTIAGTTPSFAMCAMIGGQKKQL